MAENKRTRVWTKLGLYLGPLALGGCNTTESYVNGCPDKAWPEASFLTDRSAVQNACRQQAANGAVVNATLFNYHFEPQTWEVVEGADGLPTFRALPYARPTATLGPWGKSLLDRLARNSPGPQLCVYVQTSADVVAGTTNPTAAAKARAELDAKRVQTVRDYLAALRPDLTVTVGVGDPNPVGMTGKESQAGYNKTILLAPSGFLSPSAIVGADIGAGGAGGSGGGQGQPPPASPPDPAPPPGAPAGGLAPGGGGGGGGPPSPP